YVHSGLTCDLDTGSLCTAGDYPNSDPLQDLLVGPAGLLPDEAILVVVGEQVRRPIDQPPDLRSVEPGHLLGRIGDEVKAPTAALFGMPLHSLRIIRRNYDQSEATCPLGNRLELDLARLGHCAGVERPDLGIDRVRRTDEPSG